MFKRRARRIRRPTDLLLVPMIDIFTVLVTFLLMTAVFSRITIVELDLPSAASGGATAPTFRLEVIVREEGFELTNGTALIATIPKVEGEYDVKTLAQLALSLKRDYPDANNASVLLQPEIQYDNLIQVMDAIRSAELPADSELLGGLAPLVAPPSEDAKVEAPKAAHSKAVVMPKTVRVALFTDIAVGDAP